MAERLDLVVPTVAGPVIGPEPATDSDDALPAPIRAGIRARAIADACDRLALPVIMIDGTARVLHVAASAMPLLDDSAITIAEDHLIGRTVTANRNVERALMAAIGDDAVEGAGSCPAVDGGGPAIHGVIMQGLPVRDPSVYQIMRGLIVLGPPGEMSTRIDALRAMLG